MNSRLAATAALLLAVMQTGASRAGTLDPPRYDSNLFCRSRSTTVNEGFSDQAQAHCLSDQRIAYQAVRNIWTGLPDEIQNSCTDATQVHDPQNYNALKSCILTMRRDFQPAPPKPLSGQAPQ